MVRQNYLFSKIVLQRSEEKRVGKAEFFPFLSDLPSRCSKSSAVAKGLPVSRLELGFTEREVRSRQGGVISSYKFQSFDLIVDFALPRGFLKSGTAFP